MYKGTHTPACGITKNNEVFLVSGSKLCLKLKNEKTVVTI